MKKNNSNLPFWQTKTLDEMTAAEWENLCDGCGQCCMHKLEDEDTGDLYETSVSCILLDKKTCRCRNYNNRMAVVSDCIRLTPEVIEAVRWLPKTCAYRLIAEGRDLRWWHHLVSGSYETVHEAGISVRGKIKIREDQLAEPEDYVAYVTDLL